ncbi:MAG: DedA family protein [Lentimicrobium sp.]|nr:DedA family protein [Lentimicrobium sp.]
MRFARKIYHLILEQAESKYAIPVLFIMAFMESVFSPFPFTVLLIAMAIANTSRSFLYAFTGTIGAVTGAVAGYFIGNLLWIADDGSFTGIAGFFFSNIPGFSIEAYESIQAMFVKWGVLIVLIAGFSPMPFELATITSGVFGVNFILFVIAALIARGARYFLLVWLIWKFGSKAKEIIRSYFNWIAIAMAVFIAGIIVVFSNII